MLNKLNCIQGNVSMDLSTISRITDKKSYKKKLKNKIFKINKYKSSNLISSTFTSQVNNYSVPKYMKDEFSDYSDDTDSDISTYSILEEDLNSSVSSVSSLEHEPFEVCERPSFKKKSFVRKPLLSSSRTSLFKTNHNKVSSFHPKITSSRKSLFEPKCSQCKNDSVPGASGYFSFMEDQICSSTHVSNDFKATNKSESIFSNSSIFSLSKSSFESF